jgi:hypothetical protein
MTSTRATPRPIAWSTAIGFHDGRALGPQYDGDLFVGLSTPAVLDGALFRFNLTGNRRSIAVDDPRLDDRVADDLAPK